MFRHLLVTTALMLLAASSAPAQELVAALNCGGFDTVDSQGILFEADRPYSPGGSGYVGGYSFLPPRIASSAAWSCDTPELHYFQRRGLSAYRFDLPAGEYLLRLYWLEGAEHGPRLRAMAVSVEGETLYDNLDLGLDPGFMRAFETSHRVSLVDGTLDVEFTSLRASPLISAIALWSVSDGGQAPPPLSGVSALNSYGMNILRWDVPPDFSLAAAVIYRAEQIGGPYALHDRGNLSRGAYYDWSALAGQSYYYRVAAADIWGRESVMSNPQAAQTLHYSDSALTVFRVYMAEADYDSLNSGPFLDYYYPAHWGVGAGALASVEARYRGGLARYFEKKSWKLELPGPLDYGGRTDLHLVSNPDDIYVIRNHVSLRIFDELMPWSAETEFIHLQLFGEYRGVYDLVEEVNQDFLYERGETQIGNLYKAYADMDTQPSEALYRTYYEQKAGPGEGHADLIDFIENINLTDDFAFPLYIAAKLDFENFYEYYAMMVYTRQYDFIERNYYLYHDPDTGRWALIPWDLSLCFYWDPLPLDFGTEDSPHFWNGSWNRFIDRVLRVPRLRYGYAKRLEQLHAVTLNHGHLHPLVNDLFATVQFDARRDVYKAWHEDNEVFDGAADLINYRMEQRDDQLLTMLPEFKNQIPVVCLNEHLNAPADTVPGAWDPWLEIFNFGDRGVLLSALELSASGEPGTGWTLPDQVLPPGAREVIWLDGASGGGVWHADLAPDPAGGEWLLIDTFGRVWDRTRYGPVRAAELSEGRQPDGWINWNGMTETRGAANSLLMPPRILAAALLPNQPLVGDTLSIEVAAADPAGRELEAVFYWRQGEAEQDSLLLQDSGEGSWTGTLLPFATSGMLSWWIVLSNDLGIRVSDPPGAPTYTHARMIFDETLPLFINEFMADNDTTITDEYGAHEDWLELFNASEVAIDLAGWLLSDNLATPAKWVFPADPACVIPAGGWLLVWADDDDGQGPLHTNFKLNREGEELALSLPDQTLVDYLAFGLQAPDVSFGRLEDGGAVWDFLPTATPGSSNDAGSAAESAPVLALQLRAWPNPFNPVLNLRLALPTLCSVDLAVYDIQGRRVKQLLLAALPAGAHEIVWRGLNEEGRRCASGIYFARLEAGGEARTSKIVLLK